LIRSPTLSIDWQTKLREERVGGLDFKLEALKNLEETIDELFVLLEKTGRPELLEELCPYFGQVWPSARALTEYLSGNPLEKDGAISVLEVGCGLALPSLYLARTLKYSRVSASDFHPEVPGFLRRNLELNGIPAERVTYLELDWKKADLAKYPVVIGSDILYEKAHATDVAEGLHRLTRSKGRIIVADPGRPYLQAFVDEMRARGWRAEPEIVTVSDGTPEGRKDVFILDFSANGEPRTVFRG